MAKAICAMKGWAAMTFDVATAFLSGKEVSREVLVKAPLDGLPALSEHNEPAAARRIWLVRGSAIVVPSGSGATGRSRL